jgi:hypothetical protein
LLFLSYGRHDLHKQAKSILLSANKNQKVATDPPDIISSMKLSCLYWQNRLVSRRDGLGK